MDDWIKEVIRRLQHNEVTGDREKMKLHGQARDLLVRG